MNVTLPLDLLEEAQRIAAEEKWTVGDAVVFLAKRGAAAQEKAEMNLESSYQQFMANPQDKEAGDNLISSIFGPEAIAKD